MQFSFISFSCVLLHKVCRNWVERTSLVWGRSGCSQRMFGWGWGRLWELYWIWSYFLHLQAFMRDMPLFHGSLDWVAVNINIPLLNALFGVPQ